MVKWLQSALLTLLLSAATTAGAATISLTVLPDPPPLDESFTLLFTADGAIDDDPDFTPLERDFQILRRNQQTSLELRNGRQSRTTTWTLTVLPKHNSPLVVPAVRFGAQQTAPRQLALAAAAPTAAPDEGLFLEVEATPRNPYVQQEVLYTLRLWRRYEISNAALSEPAFSGDAVVKPLNEDRHYQRTLNGQRYEVVERRFTVYPQASGPLTIKPAVVTAQVVKRGLSLFENFSQAMSTRRISSVALTLDVRPVPAAFPGQHWLPARSLRVREEWQPTTLQANLGEPITHTISVVGEGLTAGQLAPLVVVAPTGWKIYPEQPQTNDRQQDGSFEGTMVQKSALLATSAGSAALPAIEIPWWNTTLDQLEFARLAAVTLNALPGIDALPPGGATPAAATIAAATPAAPVPRAEGLPLGVAGVAGAASTYWPWVAALCGSAWLMTLFLYWRGPGHPTQAHSPPAAPGDDTAPARRLKTACARGDGAGIATALLAWGRERWPAAPPRSLAQLARCVDEPLAQQVYRLDAARYARVPVVLTSAELLAAWQHYVGRRPALAQPATQQLPQLYPAGAD
ncbi:MAG: protein BatD [Gammaproteobacteria bacterium]|nr:protein BatD [Gammaproteobacteria bacterium]